MSTSKALAPEDITQGSLVRKLLRHGSVYLASSLILALAALLLLPVNTRLFSEAEFGTISTIDSVADLLLALVSLNLTAAYVRFYHEYKNNSQDLCRYTSTIYWSVVGWGSLVVIGALLLFRHFTALNVPVWPVMVMALLSPLLIQLGQIGTGYLQQNHRSGAQIGLVLTNFFAHVAVMLLLAGIFGLGLTGKYLGVLVGAGLFSLLGTSFLLREGLLRFQFSTDMLKESLFFAIPLLPSVLAGWITALSDRVLLALYGSLAETGIYSVGYLLGRGITVFSEAVFLVYGPMIFAMIKKDPISARHRLERFVPYFFMFMLWVYVALSLFAREIVTALTPGRYLGAAVVVPVVLFAYFLGGQYKTFTFILSYERKTWAISSGSIVQALVNFVPNLILIPRFGKMAAAWTTVAAIAVFLLWVFVWSQRSFLLRLDYRRILTAGAILGVSGALAGMLAPLPLFSASLVASASIKAAFLLIALVALWFSGCILPVDKQRLVARLVRR